MFQQAPLAGSRGSGTPQQVWAHVSPSILWRRPTTLITRMAVQSYIRSGWLFGEVAYVIVAYTAFFAVFPVTLDTFFGIAQYSLWVLAALGSAVLFRRAMSVRAYLHLAWLPSRSAYVRGQALAAGALRIPIFLLLLLITIGTGKLLHPTLAWLLIGSLGVIMNCLVVVALTIALCPPIATRIEQIGFLIWLILALYSYGSGPLAHEVVLLRLPLLPFGDCFNFSIRGVIGWTDVLALVIEVFYIAGLVWLAELRLARRDLLLH